jgi:hypothetical protein
MNTQMSVNMQEKISVAEALQWLKNARSEWVSEFGDLNQTRRTGELSLLELTSLRPKDFKCPRKARVSKRESGEDRSVLPYDDARCDARVFVCHGFGAQCTRKKVNGCFCKGHQKDLDDNGGIKNGLYTEARPTHQYGDAANAIIPWHDVVDEKKSPADAPAGAPPADTTAMPSETTELAEEQKDEVHVGKFGEMVSVNTAMKAKVRLLTVELDAKTKEQEAHWQGVQLWVESLNHAA